MPLVKREIQPVFVSRGLDVIPKGIANELECVTNCTLSSVIRQLSNLARHAEDVFAELYTEANFVFKKSNALQERIDRLSVKVTQLDSVHDEDTLEGYMSQIPYHNTFNTGDQVILDNGTLPQALQETRALCDKVPSLSLLDPYREDGKEALKMYTNPKYFFELWCQDMQKNINEDEKKKEKRKRKRRQGNRGDKSNKPAKVKTRKEQYKAMGMGQEFMPTKSANENKGIQSPTSDPGSPTYDAPSQQDPRRSSQSQHDRQPSQDTYINQEAQSVTSPEDRRRSHGHRRRSSGKPRKAPAPPPPAPPPADYNTNESQYGNLPMPPDPNDMPMPSGSIMPPNNDIPPPPPPPPPFDHSIPPAPPVPNGNIPPPPPPPPPSTQVGGTNIPAPPPPPPGMPNTNIPVPPPPPPPGALTSTPTPTLAPAKRISQAPTPPIQVDSRSELLKAIQQGMNLKRVQVTEKQVRDERTDTVESILRRRIALQQSDTESDSSGSSSDLEEWSDQD